ncbi:hypothetical protein [Thermofilum sp.]
MLSTALLYILLLLELEELLQALPNFCSKPRRIYCQDDRAYVKTVEE